MNININFLKESILAFIATMAFSVMLNIPKKELLYCGIAGGIGWFFYSVCISYGFSSSFSNFIGTLCVTYLARLFAVIRKAPISVFLISGIISLVPGTSIYKTALNIIMLKDKEATFYALETIKISCAIAFAIFIILSLPPALFKIRKIKS